MENFERIKCTPYMKKIVFFVFIILLSYTSFAQKKIIVSGNFPSIYINHKVAQGDTWYGISRLYKLDVITLAKYNNTSAASILNIGQIVAIPLDKNNFTQTGQAGENETLVPVHYVVNPGDNVFRIGQNFGKLRLDFLREWNDLNNDIIQPGQKIIIGHLIVENKQVGIVLDRAGTNNNVNETTTVTAGTATTKPATNETTTTETKEPIAKTNSADDEGFFAADFPTKLNPNKAIVKNGDAASFKTTSGWNDRKYYALINDVAPGTIIRITATNGRSVCAKVLGALPDMKENKTLLLRISNAAASVLQTGDGKFTLKVMYFE